HLLRAGVQDPLLPQGFALGVQGLGHEGLPSIQVFVSRQLRRDHAPCQGSPTTVFEESTKILLVVNGQVPQPPERLKRHAMATATTSETDIPGTCSVSYKSPGAVTVDESRVTHIQSGTER